MALKSRPRFYNASLPLQSAWLGTIVAVSLNAVGMLIELKIGSNVAGMPKWPAVGSSIVGICLFVILMVRRKNMTLRLATIVYLINCLTVVTCLLFTNPYYALAVKAWHPFQAAKLGCLIAALIAPGFWIGMIGISLYALTSVTQFVLWPDQIKEKIALGEPWAMLAFSLAGFFALIYRFRMVELKALEAASHHLASVLLKFRDLMNTPLQTIEISTNLLRDQPEHKAEILDSIGRAVLRLREVNSALSQYEKDIDWKVEN